MKSPIPRNPRAAKGAVLQRQAQSAGKTLREMAKLDAKRDKAAALSNGQRLMVEDGLPQACLRTPASESEWAKAWEGKTLAPTLSFKEPPKPVDPELAAMREQFERDKQTTRISKLHAGQARKAIREQSAQAIRQGQRWDPRKARFVDDPFAKPPSDGLVRPPKGDKPAKAAAAPKVSKPKGEPGVKKRTRVDVTMEQLANWCSAEELAAAFEKEFGDGKVNTAKLAIGKVPPKFGRKVEKKTDTKRGVLFRLIPATGDAK